MAVLALLLPDAAASARFASALDARDRVIHAPSWRQLLRLVMRYPVDLCVIDVYDPFRPISFNQLQRFRRRHPNLAIVVHSDFRGREADLFDLGRLQVDGVFQATGHEPRSATRHAVERALARATASRVLRVVDGRLPPFALDALGWAVESAERDVRVADLAAALGTTPRSLGRDLREHDLPSPRQLLAWGRILQAVRMLETAGSTVDEVAYRVRYSTGGALRRAIKRLTGLPPRTLIRRGGLTVALDRFLESVTRPGVPPARSPDPRQRSRRARRHWARPARPRASSPAPPRGAPPETG